VFKIAPKEGVDIEELELELIDYGLMRLIRRGRHYLVWFFESFNKIQKYLEDNGFEITSAEFEYILTI
jgi:transcriptional/translational regulatory protein YebC/TACO1